MQQRQDGGPPLRATDHHVGSELPQEFRVLLYDVLEVCMLTQMRHEVFGPDWIHGHRSFFGRFSWRSA